MSRRYIKAGLDRYPSPERPPQRRGIDADIRAATAALALGNQPPRQIELFRRQDDRARHASTSTRGLHPAFVRSRINSARIRERREHAED